MAKYRIIGKTKHLTSVYLNQEGRFKQHRILSGKIIEDVDESELTFHVDRLVGKGDIKLVKVEEEAEEVIETPVVKPVETEPVAEEPAPPVEIEETVEEPTPTVRKRGRGRKKKKTENSEE